MSGAKTTARRIGAKTPTTSPTPADDECQPARDAAAKAAACAKEIARAVAPYNESSSEPLSDLPETFNGDDAALLRAMGLLSYATNTRDVDRESVTEALNILSEVRESLIWCVRGCLETAGVIAAEDAKASA